MLTDASEGVKLGPKKFIVIDILPKSSDENKEEESQAKQIEYFISQKEPTWGGKFKAAVCLGPSIDDNNMVDPITNSEAFFHFLCIGWKLLFAFIPPNNIWNGKLAFIVALTFIGIVTAIVGEVANLFGCVAGLKSSVTAITFVALGTSLPDTFASMTAARNSKNADSAIGNITGSNGVNVFLGLGLPWMIATIYKKANYDTHYKVPAGDLSFYVIMFLICTVIWLVVIMVRRCVSVIIVKLLCVGAWI
jgi:solute carrier family 8 (sodium/calcium exchanger)